MSQNKDTNFKELKNKFLLIEREKRKSELSEKENSLNQIKDKNVLFYKS